MSNLEQCLEALARRGDLQDVGVVRLTHGMGHSSLPYKIQGIDPTYFRRYRVTESAHIL